MFLGSDDVMVSEMYSEKVWLVLCASLVIHLFAKEDAVVVEYIIMHFRDRGFAVPLLNLFSVYTWS